MDSFLKALRIACVIHSSWWLSCLQEDPGTGQILNLRNKRLIVHFRLGNGLESPCENRGSLFISGWSCQLKGN